MSKGWKRAFFIRFQALEREGKNSIFIAVNRGLHLRCNILPVYIDADTGENGSYLYPEFFLNIFYTVVVLLLEIQEKFLWCLFKNHGEDVDRK